MSNGTVDNGRLFFADTSTFEEDPVAIRGGLLITDRATKPYEFRCTSAVKPTRLQRVMYGKTLDPYVHVELIGVPMIKAAKEEPSIVIVRKRLLLGVRPFLEVPVVLLEEGEETPGFKIVTHEDYPDDKLVAENVIPSKLDVSELFDRVEIALDEAHKQTIGDDDSPVVKHVSRR